LGHLPAWVDGDRPEDELFVRFGITPEELHRRLRHL